MEIEASPAPVVAKKLWNIIRIVMIMLRKGIAKSKAMAEFHLLLKRGKLAIANTLTLHHRHFAAAAFTCHRPNNNNNNNLSFLSPHEYEFSCSNSPAKNHHHHCHRHRRHSLFSKRCKYDNVLTKSAVQRVLETLDNNNNGDVVVEGGGNYSPFVALPGVGKSPIGKRLRITDSPFPLKEEEGDDGGQVDMAAEEFIKRFYKNLNSQQNAMDSPRDGNGGLKARGPAGIPGLGSPRAGIFFPVGTGTRVKLPPRGVWGRGLGLCPPPRGDPAPKGIFIISYKNYIFINFYREKYINYSLTSHTPNPNFVLSHRHPFSALRPSTTATPFHRCKSRPSSQPARSSLEHTSTPRQYRPTEPDCNSTPFHSLTLRTQPLRRFTLPRIASSPLTSAFTHASKPRSTLCGLTYAHSPAPPHSRTQPRAASLANTAPAPPHSRTQPPRRLTREHSPRAASLANTAPAPPHSRTQPPRRLTRAEPATDRQDSHRRKTCCAICEDEYSRSILFCPCGKQYDCTHTTINQ